MKPVSLFSTGPFLMFLDVYKLEVNTFMGILIRKKIIVSSWRTRVGHFVPLGFWPAAKSFTMGFLSNTIRSCYLKKDPSELRHY